jgi:hypothetical protein
VFHENCQQDTYAKLLVCLGTHTELCPISSNSQKTGLVNFIAIIVIGILIWMDLCKLFGKPSWLGVLSVLTPVGLVLEGYLAFSSVLPVENVVSTPAPVPTPMPPSTPMPAQNPMM